MIFDDEYIAINEDLVLVLKVEYIVSGTWF